MSADEHPRFDVLIIGGGNAGISAAARLLKKGVERVAVIEPSTPIVRCCRMSAAARRACAMRNEPSGR